MRVYTRIPAEFRFWQKVRQAGDCWEWTASKGGSGYGHFFPTRKKLVVAHKWAYEQMVGPVPEGLQLDHLCRNTSCVNPYHLDPVPAKVNGHRSDSWAGVNSRKTHCPEEHPYTGDNLLINEKGARVCLTCKRARWRAYYHRKKAS